MYRTWHALAAAAGIIAIVVGVGIIHHIPTIRYQWEYGRNPITDRHPEEADSYGMKIAHLILPIPDHNLSVLADLRVRIWSRTGRARGKTPARSASSVWPGSSDW